MKVKSKISYLGERNSILPGQMAEQLAVEVNVKNVMEHGIDVKNITYICTQDKPQYLSWIHQYVLHKC